ncbi:MAG: hypothetical protein PUD80_03125, partial [Firmicutes bacterium]|nr:hypothetical protein [Bacillota bacterium]
VAPVRIRRNAPDDCSAVLPLISQKSKIFATFPEGEGFGTPNSGFPRFSWIFYHGATGYARGKAGNAGLPRFRPGFYARRS